MRITYESKREIPTTGHIVLVRDEVMYHRITSDGAFYPLFGNKVEPKTDTIYQVVNSDILYHFPERTSAFKQLKSNGCLDKFLVKPDSAQSRQTKITELLNLGKFVGGHWDGNPKGNKRGRLDFKDGTLYGFYKSGVTTSANPNLGYVGNDLVYQEQFDTIYELFAWMYDEKA